MKRIVSLISFLLAIICIVFQTDLDVAYSDEFDSVKKVYSMPLPTLDLQERNIKVLKTAKKDLEDLFLIASYLRRYHIDDLKLFEEYAREYVVEGIDSLLSRETMSDRDDVKKMLFDLKYLEALFFYEIQDMGMACQIIKDLESQYNQGQNVSVNFMGNKIKPINPYMVMTNFRYACKHLN
jgi:hypothetical protein